MRLIVLLTLLIALGASAGVGDRFWSLFNDVDRSRDSKSSEKEPDDGIFDETNWNESTFQ